MKKVQFKFCNPTKYLRHVFADDIFSTFNFEAVKLNLNETLAPPMPRKNIASK